MKYRLLAESSQHQCVCGGFSSSELAQSVEGETTSSSDRLYPSENCGENITDMNQSNSNAQSESVSKKISGESGDSVNSENKRTSDAGIEPDQSQTHSCVKRLKIDHKNSTEGCSADENNYSDEINYTCTSTANKNNRTDKVGSVVDKNNCSGKSSSVVDKNNCSGKSSSVVDKNNCTDKSNSDRNNSSDKSSSIGNESFKSSPVGDKNKCTDKCSSVGDKSSSIGDKYNCRITTKCSDENAKMSVIHQNCLENYGLNMRQEQKQNELGPCLSSSHFLERSVDSDHFKQFSVPEDMLKRFIVMDIINPCSRKSTCFTKR